MLSAGNILIDSVNLVFWIFVRKRQGIPIVVLVS